MERSVDEKNSRSKNSLVRPTPIPRSPKVNEVVKREGIEKEKPLLKRMCYVKEKEIDSAVCKCVLYVHGAYRLREPPHQLRHRLLERQCKDDEEERGEIHFSAATMQENKENRASTTHNIDYRGSAKMF